MHRQVSAQACIEHDMYTLFIRTMQINPNAVNEHSLNIHEPSQSSTPAARNHVDAIVSTSQPEPDSKGGWPTCAVLHRHEAIPGMCTIHAAACGQLRTWFVVRKQFELMIQDRDGKYTNKQTLLARKNHLRMNFVCVYYEHCIVFRIAFERST